MYLRSMIVSGALLLSGFCTLVSPQTKPNEDDAIRVETLLVSVPVVVSDRNGRYVANLTKKDFTVFQDGKQVPVEFFAAVEEPISVALLIDTSQSTRPVLDDIKDSARSFIKLLNPKDRAMIVSFDYQINVLSPLTSDASQLKRAVDRAEIPPQGMTGTVLRDAVYETVARTFAGLKGRKAIILLTDGKDMGSDIGTDALFYRLQETDTLIYPVMFSTGPGGSRNAGRNLRIFGPDGSIRGLDSLNPRQQQRIQQAIGRIGRQNEIAREILIGMSEATAGRFYSSEDGKLKKTFASIVEELRFQYRLGYYPPEETSPNQLHQIRVKITRPDTVVRARTSYRASNK
jgi:Ca-activated chloride channel family protein